VRRYATELEARVRARTAELAASEARFRAVYEQAAVGIALLDEEERIVASNPALQRMLGHEAHELEGMALSALALGKEMDRRGGFPTLRLRSSARFHSPTRPYDETRPYDAAIPAAGVGAPSSPPPVAPEALPAPGQRDARQGGIEGGHGEPRPYRQAECRCRRKDGGTIHANVTTSPIHLAGEPARLSVALIEDVTERMQAQEALRRSERLAMTGRLAASVAHEIGNPLQAVIGCLSLAQEARAAGEDTARYMQVAMDELDRAARLVGRMRDLNRPTEGKREAVEVNDLVERVLLLSRKQCQNQHVEVRWEAGQDLPAVAAVADRVQQVFLNLVLNAVDAMPGGGELAVRTAHTPDPAGVAVTFADTGTGIPEEQLERLFEPFASTKTEGLGLGLYVSRNIVHEHGGHIQVDSRPGQGTTFTVWLPAE